MDTYTTYNNRKESMKRTYYTICHLCGEDTQNAGDTNAVCDGYRWCGCGVNDRKEDE